VQQSGGLLLTPVQTLAATLIFFRDGERKCKSSPVVCYAKHRFGTTLLIETSRNGYIRSLQVSACGVLFSKDVQTLKKA